MFPRAMSVKRRSGEIRAEPRRGFASIHGVIDRLKRKLTGDVGAAWFACSTLWGCPDDPLAEARKLERDRQLAEAAAAYLEVARADPAHLAAWDAAARIHCRERRSISDCLQLLDLELELLGQVERHGALLAEALEARGRARLKQGMVHAALEDLTRSQEVAPDRASIFLAQARAYLMQGRQVEAEERIRQARRREPGHPELDELESMIRPTDSP